LPGFVHDQHVGAVAGLVVHCQRAVVATVTWRRPVMDGVDAA
jgi:hypothetical protein